MFIIIDFAKAFRILASLILMFLILILTTTAYAATVNRSKGKAVEIRMDADEDFVKGDKVWAIREGKKVGKIEIVKIKQGKKAIGRLLKGKAPKDAFIQLIEGKSSAASSDDSSDDSKASGGFLPDGAHAGIVFGFASNSQSLKGAIETVEMTGTSISYKAYVDYPLSESFGVIARIGMDNFVTKGTAANSASCEGTTACETKLNYLAADALARFSFGSGTLTPFAYGGVGIIHPLSKSTNALNEAKLSTETRGILGGGMYYQLSKTMFIPVTLELAALMPTETQTTYSIIGAAGFGMYF
jgi:opacity protein-like surface antigen